MIPLLSYANDPTGVIVQNSVGELRDTVGRMFEQLDDGFNVNGLIAKYFQKKVHSFLYSTK